MNHELRSLLFDAFSEKDVEIISKLADNAKYEHIAAAVIIDSKEKEDTLQRFINRVKPVVIPENESEVKKELWKAEAHGQGIKTPAEEAEWQRRLDEEKALKKDLEPKKDESTDALMDEYIESEVVTEPPKEETPVEAFSAPKKRGRKPKVVKQVQEKV